MSDPSVCIVSYADAGGGAFLASHRLHRALVDSGVSSRMRVMEKRTGDPTVAGPAGTTARVVARARYSIAWRAAQALGPRDGAYRSLAVFPTGLRRELDVAAEDLLHLHWICGEMISVRQMARLRKPLLWTLHDEWAMRGAEHIASSADRERWRHGYVYENRPASTGRLDLDRWVWERKRAAWRRPMTAVCPSRWLAGRAAESMLLRPWRIEVIPNPIDTDTWQPRLQEEARARLGLPPAGPLVVFGAIGGTSDPNKGADLLRAALEQLAATSAHPFYIGIFGQHAAKPGESWPAPVTYFGHIERPEYLMDVYAAADVVIVPSRIENLPNVAVEAQCCGTPVVAFATGGIPECVLHGETGYLARPFDTAELAACIARILDEPECRRALGEAARRHAERTYSSRAVVPRYLDLYRELVDLRGRVAPRG